MKKNTLKIEFVYNKKNNKIQISSLLEEVSPEDCFELERIFVEEKQNTTNFILYTKLNDFQIAENLVKINAFEYFKKNNDEKAMKKIAQYISVDKLIK